MIQKLMYAGGISLLCLCIGCGPTAIRTSASPQEQAEVAHPHVPQAPGTAQVVWEEPMVDVIDVPPGLDPEGIYYRPAHQAVVEIRQGRWQYYRQESEKRN